MSESNLNPDAYYKINHDALSFLERKELIDSRVVIWWQKGFEGRKVYSEENFDRELVDVSYSAYKSFCESDEIVEYNTKVWDQDNVPILFRNYVFEGHTVKAFVSVKPMSHDGPQNGWWELQSTQKNGEGPPISLYLSPHIRGIVVENTSDHVFWLPLGGKEERWNSCATCSGPFIFEDQDIPHLFMPIHPSRFCHNLMYRLRKGRAAQKKFERWKFERDGFEVVPYFAFDSSQKHLCVYPARVLSNRLDLPIILQGGNGGNILGMGYFELRDCSSSQLIYVSLDKKKRELARTSIESRLGINLG